MIGGLARAQEPPRSTTPTITPAQVEAQIKLLQAQAELGRATAAEVKAAPLDQIVPKLRTAESEGLANAWLPRRRITDASAETSTSVSEADRQQALHMLQGQADRQDELARDLRRAVIRARGSAEELVGRIQAIKPSTAVGIMISAPVDPASGKVGGEVASPISLFVYGVGAAATADFPSVAAVVMRHDNVDWVGCTGTLISARVVLTAGHCQDVGDPVSVFFQGVGSRDIVQIVRHEDYALVGAIQEPVNDIALLILSEPVVQIRPAVLAASPTEIGALGRIVGFGSRSVLASNGAADGSNGIVRESGLKLFGQIETTGCTATHQPNRVCWQFKGGRNASTCTGDSGGPLFVQQGGEVVLSGVTSFGLGGTWENPCPPSVSPVDTDVAPYVPWIQAKLALLDASPGAPVADALAAADNPDLRYVLRKKYQRVSSATKPSAYAFSVAAPRDLRLRSTAPTWARQGDWSCAIPRGRWLATP